MLILLAFDGAVAVVRRQSGRRTATLDLVDRNCLCLAVAPHRAGKFYCGTFDAGLHVSDDGGASWRPVAGALPQVATTAVAVSPLEKAGGVGVLWAGTEPSALYRSADAGESWEELPVSGPDRARFTTVNAIVVAERS